MNRCQLSGSRIEPASGQFDVALDDVPLTPQRKAPRNPLLLLKLLVAFGRRDEPVSRLGHDPGVRIFRAVWHVRLT
jgi:hypothetical protein